MSEYKYTKDGKKVLIVGKLNNQETIVQEVFVAENETEIASGENFVVRNLLDAPMKTWQEDRIANLDAALKRMNKDLAEREDEVKSARLAATATAKALRAFASNAVADQLETVEAFVSGKVTHLVYVQYGSPSVREFTDAVRGSKDFDFERDSVKLLSLFGRSDGRMDWRIHQYSDHSGSAGTVIPACGYADAVRIVQERYDADVQKWRAGGHKQPPSAKWIENVPEINVPSDVLAYWRDCAEQSRQTKIAELEQQLEKLRSESVA